MMAILVTRIEHDPTDSNLSITLSPTGLRSFGTETSATQSEQLKQ